MRDNPEWQRLVWLEITQPRLILGPLLMFVAFLISYRTDDMRVGESTTWLGMALFLMITVLWGGLQVSGSLFREVRQKTWDGQRLSAMTPATLFWGKLLGGAVYGWLLGVPCLVIYTLGLNQMGVSPAERVILQPLILIAVAIDWHLLGLVGALVVLPSLRRDNGPVISSITMVIMVLLSIFAMVYMLGSMSMVGIKCWEGCDQFLWYMISFSNQEFFLLTLVILMPWLILGGLRLLGNELQYSRSSFSWLGFCVFLTLYVLGLEMGNVSTVYVIFIVLLSIIYFALLLEEKDLVLFSRLRGALAAGAWLELLAYAPVWMLTMGYGLVLLLFMYVIHFLWGGEGGVGMLLFQEGDAWGGLWLFVMLFAYLARDVVVVLVIHTLERVRRPDSAALIVLFALYILLPWPFASADLNGMVLLFRPDEEIVGGPAITLLVPLLETMMLAIWLRNRLRRLEV